jgi:predicted dehydrogenase
VRRLRWGVLSTADIGLKAVVPGLQAGESNEVRAIASRELGRSREVAARLGIPRAYGSYEELLADPEIDAIYNPLPNHLHVPWSIRALEAGKHVLCEKPIGLNAGEALELLAQARRHAGLKVMEAFMYRHHPQWRRAVELLHSGSLGRLVSVQSLFSYHKTDPGNIRNRSDMGGGGMLDIGCYCVSLSRLLWDGEPQRVLGLVEYDPVLGIDRLASGILEFAAGSATFTCGTQLTPYQRVQVLGESGRLEIIRPFNAQPRAPMKLRLEREGEIEEILVPPADQYRIQGELFARAVLDDTPVPVPLEDGVANMRVIDAVFESGRSGGWVDL